MVTIPDNARLTTEWVTIVWYWLARTVEYGTVPDWFASAGAVLALFWARKAVRAATETNETQRKQLAALEMGRRQEQASRIAVWPVQVLQVTRPMKVGEVGDQIAIHEPVPGQYILHFCLRNSSDLPVFDVMVYSDERAYSIGEEMSHLIPSGKPMKFKREFYSTIRKTSDAKIGVLFRDASGQHWNRRPNGILDAVSIDIYEGLVDAVRSNAETISRVSREPH